MNVSVEMRKTDGMLLPDRRVCQGRSAAIEAPLENYRTVMARFCVPTFTGQRLQKRNHQSETALVWEMFISGFSSILANPMACRQKASQGSVLGYGCVSL